MYYFVHFTIVQHLQFMIDFIFTLQNVNFTQIRIHGQQMDELCHSQHTITISNFQNQQWLSLVEFYLHWFTAEGYELVWIDVDYLPLQLAVDDGYESG